MIMNQTMVTTNLRLPYVDWIQVRALAAEEGMSVNEYVNYMINVVSKARGLAVGPERIPLKPVKRDPIWGWPDLAAKLKMRPMGLSADDELIYG